MKNYHCDIIKDLLPLYVDDVCSEEAKKAVEEHIAECEDCRRELENMKETIDSIPKTEGDESAPLKKIKRKTLWNKILIGIICTMVGGAVFLGGYYYLFIGTEEPISYEHAAVTAEPDDEADLIRVYFGDRNYTCLYMKNNVIKTEGNLEYTEEYLYCTDSAWTRHFGKNIKGEEMTAYPVRSITRCEYQGEGEVAAEEEMKVLDKVSKNIKLTSQYPDYQFTLQQPVRIYYQTPGSDPILLWEDKDTLEKIK